MGCCCLTPQEEHIINGMEISREGRERTLKINDMIRKEPIRMNIERAVLFTESMKQTEGENLSLRWAKALLHIAENIKLYVEPDYELLVGKTNGAGMGRYSILYPELDGPSLLQLRGAEKRPVSPFVMSEEDLQVVEEVLYPYWKEGSYAQAYAQALPEETRKIIFGDDRNNFSKQQYVISQSTTARSSSNFNYDLETILKRGMKSFQDEAEARLAEVKVHPKDYVKYGAFWEAAILCCQAFTIYAHRYAMETRRVAETVQSQTRRAELLEIADNCEWVATNPARDFRSALQLQWFVMAFVRLEQMNGASLGNARMDQHLLPYYQQDIASGKLTRAQAKELLECYWLNLSQITLVPTSESSSKLFEAYAHFETVTIGGQTKDGADATNELSYLILESKQGFPTTYPDLAVRVHAGSPEKFLRACAEVIKEGQGFPKLFNDEEIVPLYIAKGATYEEALDYAVSGCTETRIINRETYTNGCAGINLGAIVEMTMHDGRLKILNNKQIGLPTGDPRNFKTFDEFFAAYRAQHENILRHAMIQQMVSDEVRPTKLAAPLTSLFVGACRDASTDINDYVPNSIREAFVGHIGYATMIDSIAAVKKVVYDDKSVTMDELIKALDANFEGYEVVQQLLINAPKYGNNDPYADNIGKQIDHFVCEYLAQNPGVHGEIFSMRVVPVTFHIPSGKVTGATPNGRKAGDYLSEGSSASHGAENNGPTAILLSNRNVKCEGYKERAARLLNIKLSPGMVAGDEGTRRLVSFIRTWCDLKLWHVQFNVVNKETLVAAKADPQHYKDLIVRVAGYSAYFVDMSPTLQDELIGRAEMAI
ncbi:MAG: glycyl radical protein [Peptococcaceae bacterium]